MLQELEFEINSLSLYFIHYRECPFYHYLVHYNCHEMSW